MLHFPTRYLKLNIVVCVYKTYIQLHRQLLGWKCHVPVMKVLSALNLLERGIKKRKSQEKILFILNLLYSFLTKPEIWKFLNPKWARAKEPHSTGIMQLQIAWAGKVTTVITFSSVVISPNAVLILVAWKMQIYFFHVKNEQIWPSIVIQFI